MDPLDDIELLREYVSHHSEAAFTTLVERHLGLIYSAALRRVRDPGLAEEVAQAVCIALARKARTLTRRSSLSGWLYQATRFAGAKALRSQIHRQRREHEAAQMQMNPDDDCAWQSLVPFLDQAMDELRDKDRQAVLLRFFQNESLEGVGSALGISEEAAKKRVARALEKLRSSFARRGAVLSAAAIAGLLSANAVQAAPVTVTASVMSIALANGASAAASTLAILKATLRSLAWAKARVAVTAFASVLAVGATAVLVHQVLARSEQTQNFQVKGEMVRETADYKGDTLTGQKSIARYSFSITVNGPRWFLHVHGDKPLDYDYCEIAFDGSSLYYVCSLKTWVRTQKLAGKQIGPNTAMGTVVKRQVPQIGINDEVGPIWLAYASAEFFRTHTNDAPTPTPATLGVGKRGLSGTLNYYHQPTIVRASGRSPAVPKEAIYVENEPIGGYSQSFTNAVFRVETYTNIGLVSIPSTATFTVYFPLRSAAGAPVGPEPMYVYRLVTSAVQPGKPLESVRPELPDLTAVSDLRFVDDPNEPAKPLYYYVKGAWYSDSEARALPEYATALRQARRETTKLQTGDPAPDFNVSTLDGKEIKLADFRGKYVLLDFWTTWCTPCVEEIPNLKAIYGEFGGRNRLVMIGMSLDHDPEKLRRFVQSENLAWPQVFLGFFRPGGDTLTPKYGVHAAGRVFLIAPDGSVVASDLRGSELKEAVAAALEEP